MRVRRGWRVALAAAACLAWSGARAECVMGKILEMPVTMRDLSPTVSIKVNGHDARFIADSGAFYSMISPGSAAELALPLENAPPGFYVQGIGGKADVQVAKVKSLGFGATIVPNVYFLVGGSETGTVGLLGQNVLGIEDVEYDLAGGAIRLMRARGCRRSNLAYWVKPGQAYSVLSIEAPDGSDRHTKGTITVNGAKFDATFDTGASLSLMTVAAARRAGIRLDGPGVVETAAVGGIGRKHVRSWIAQVASLKIGDEEIRNTRLRISDVPDAGFDMLIGADFFLSHRVYVSNVNRKLFFSYSGGPVFNLTAAATTDAAAAAGPDLSDAEAYATRGAARAARRDIAGALADLDRAVSLVPGEPRFLVRRAGLLIGQHKLGPAAADLDAALKLAPDDAEARLARAELRLAAHDKEGARSDIDLVAHAISPASNLRKATGHVYLELDDFPAAIAEFDRWIKVHPDDSHHAEALNARCWARALAGRELDMAIADCTAALRRQPRTPEILDSLGLVQLRAGRTDAAIATYDRALAIEAKLAWSLYGRGIARLRKGDKAGQADIDAATSIDAELPAKARRYGVTG